MLNRFFAILLILITLYTLSVFLTPTLADRYGFPAYNQKIRVLKWSLERDPGNSGSLYENIRSTTKTYVDESKSTLDQIQKTVTAKSKDVQDAALSVQEVYHAVEKAKDDFGKLTTFSTGSTGTGSP